MPSTQVNGSAKLEHLRVVGLGASAGGLQALESFFSTVSPDSGLAYVVVQHLAAQHVSMLAQILGRRAQLPVANAEHGMLVQADHVYTIPAGAVLGLDDGRFSVTVHDGDRRQVIDLFFRALAADRGVDAVGVVLSGSGTDGTEGLAAIHRHGGLTLAQAPETAKHDSMPAAAIAAGVVDRVLPPEQMLPAILEHPRQQPSTPAGPPEAARPSSSPPARDDAPSDEHLSSFIPRVCETLERTTGHDFSQYKRGTVIRRLRRRITSRGSESIEAYVDALAEDPQEPALLAKELLIGVTEFFRDPEAMEFLAQQVIPKLISAAQTTGSVRIWVPGCASGEEAYSLAMLLLEGFDTRGPKLPVQIFATDIDIDAIAEARQAIYSPDITKQVSPERLARFFRRDGDRYRIAREVRELCIFSEHNVIRDPPFIGIDLISCRNLLIYMDADLQRRVISLFHYALRPGGHLLLGMSESLVHSEQFEVVDKHCRLFERREVLRRPSVDTPPARPELPPREGPVRSSITTRPSLPHNVPTVVTPPHADVNTAFERLMLQEYVPPSAVVNERGEVLCVAGRTGPYLQPPAGILTTNILDIAHTNLRIELRAALHTALRTNSKVVRDGVPVDIDGSLHLLRITVRPLVGVEPKLFAVVLQERVRLSDEAPAQRDSEAAMEELETELRTTRADLRATIGELGAANEELRSANEELLSTNEELQSANEELQSSQEELQSSQEELNSLNEELITVNVELSHKVEELSRANSDLYNLFSATDIATIFLDRQLRVSKFTPTAKRLFRLIDGDVGRPLADLAPRFVDLDLTANAGEVLRSLSPIERQVQTLDGGSWYLLRIIPYRTHDEEVAGAVVTLADISGIKQAEAARSTSEMRYRSLFESIDEGFCVVEVLFDDADNPVDYRFVEVNPAFEPQTGIGEAVGRRMREIAPTHEQSWFRIFGQVAKTGEPVRFESFATALDRHYDVYAFRAGEPTQHLVAVLFNDITARKQQEAEREQLLQQLRAFQAQLSADLDGMIRLQRIGSLFLEAGNVDAVLGEILDAAIAITGADMGNIQLVDPHAGELAVALQRGLPDAWLKFWHDQGNGCSAARSALERGERVIVANVEHSPLFAGTPALRVHLDAGVRAISSTPIFGRSGSPVGVISTYAREPGSPAPRVLRLLDLLARQAADIFERARGEDALRSANVQLIEADERKNHFLAMLSHELRNPLAAVRASLGVLDHVDASSDEAQQASAIIRRQIGQLTRLIEDLLDITRLSSGKIQLARELFDLDELVQRVAADYRWAFESAHAQLEVRLPDAPTWVDADPVRLTQAIGNLLQNAAKFSPSASVTTLSVEPDSAARRVFVRVRDTGVGIDPKLLPRVFDPFVQADKTLDRSSGGLGLGLAVVKGLIELHGGSVHVSSDGPGLGTTFTIELALADARSVESHRATPSTTPVALRVLMIEDNPDTSLAMTLLLLHWGHQVDTANSGRRGLDKARATRPDIVICDIGLPEMNGYEVVQALRAEFEQLPVIGLSGYAKQEDIDKAMAAGFDAYLVKPASPELLQRTLQKLAGGPANPSKT